MYVAEVTTLYGGQSSSWLKVSSEKCCGERIFRLYYSKNSVHNFWVVFSLHRVQIYGGLQPPPHLFFLSALQDHLKSLAFRQGLRAFSVLLNPDVLQISPSKCFLTSPHSPQLYSRLSSEELLCHVWRLNTIIQVFQQD